MEMPLSQRGCGVETIGKPAIDGNAGSADRAKLQNGLRRRFIVIIIINNYEYGEHKTYKYGGHPAPAGRALPNLINAVRMLKSKSTPHWLSPR